MDYSSLAAASKAAMEERRAALEEKQSLSLGTVLSPSRLLILTDPYTSKQGEQPGTGFLDFSCGCSINVLPTVMLQTLYTILLTTL